MSDTCMIPSNIGFATINPAKFAYWAMRPMGLVHNNSIVIYTALWLTKLICYDSVAIYTPHVQIG